MKTLGRLSRVKVRDVWSDEARDFTPWLAQEENLELLASTIQVDLELESVEKAVGPFRADILCKDTISETWVLIENQLGRTDHTHLGQLMTYAAGLDAITIVWVAARFTDEHRAALDWLNKITSEDAHFFGLEVELWRIGESDVAPKFNIVSKPNEWSRSITAATENTLTETRQLQLEYWTAWREHMLERSYLNPHSARGQHWTNVAIGHSDFLLQARINANEKTISVALNLHSEDAKAFFALLYAERQEIEDDFGQSLEWLEKLETKRSLISLAETADIYDRTKWEAQHEWFRQTLESFDRVFRRRIAKLDVSDLENISVNPV